MANCIHVVYIIHVIYDPVLLMSVMVDLCCHFIHIAKFHSCVNIIHVMRINHMVVKFINLLVSSMAEIHPSHDFHLCNQFHLYGHIYMVVIYIIPCQKFIRVDTSFVHVNSIQTHHFHPYLMSWMC
jgi:hypothetical protein